MTVKKNDKGQAARAFYDKRTQWINFIVECSDLKHSTVRIGVFIALRANADLQYSFWTVRKIALQIGCSTKTVSEATSELVDHNLLIVFPHKGRVNGYQIKLPFEGVT